VCEPLNAAVGTGDGGRDHDWEDVQTIIQITAKLTPELPSQRDSDSLLPRAERALCGFDCLRISYAGLRFA
jgi:hypothetical protein